MKVLNWKIKLGFRENVTETEKKKKTEKFEG